MRLILLLISFELLLSGCMTIPRPNTYLCVVNAPGGKRKCYNLKTDYDSEGNLKPDAVAVYRQNVTIDDLNKAVIVDGPNGFEDGWAELKAYIKQLREAYDKQQQQCQGPGHDGGR